MVKMPPAFKMPLIDLEEISAELAGAAHSSAELSETTVWR